MKQNLYSIQYYTKNPETGKGGWEIKYISVYADSYEEACEKMNDVPDFDAVILISNLSI